MEKQGTGERYSATTATASGRVNHDILIDRLGKRIRDAGMLRLIRAYLNSGIMDHGVVRERYQGTPQGGPLSPLLANVLLDEVDKELERRGHCFVRYADDANVYVRSRRAGDRVMALLRRLYGKLRLTVNTRPRARWPACSAANSWASPSGWRREARSNAKSRPSRCRRSSGVSGA